MPVNGELRAYQREGVAWLAFLRRCGLHGVLGDDMGLGKTLQASASIAGAPCQAWCRAAGCGPGQGTAGPHHDCPILGEGRDHVLQAEWAAA